MDIKDFLKNNRDILILLFLIIISFFCDFYWNGIFELVPAWDQGFHLSNVYRFTNLLNETNILQESWWNSFWTVTDNYRGPLSYIISAKIINIFGISLKNAILSNTFFNIITLLSIYIFCKKFISKEVGLFSCVIYTFNPFIFNIRNDYLIDLQQVSFIYLSWLILSLWYFSTNKQICLAFFSGISLGLLFLTKPVSLGFLFIPVLLIIVKKIYKKNVFNIFKNSPLVIFVISFYLVIKQWLGQNWLTIITSTLNAWQWGIKYQDGLEANTLEGWLYYPRALIEITNPIILFTFLSIYLIYNFKFNYKNLNNKKFFNDFFNYKKFAWFYALPINIIFLSILMSSKDPRFILPLFPLICILISILLSKLDNKYKYSAFAKFLFLLTIFTTLLLNQLKIYSYSIQKSNSFVNPNIIHNEILSEVHNNSPFLKSNIGFIPDTKFYNAFNLDAEALRVNKGIRVRQIMSNLDSYKKDIKFYDWFLLKSGNQGEMTSKARNQLANLVSNSGLFEVKKEWKIHDDSLLKLMKRKQLSEELLFDKCTLDSPKMDIKFLKKGLKINIYGRLSQLNNSHLLLDIKNQKNKEELNFSLPKNVNITNNDRCINISINNDSLMNFDEISSKSEIKALILNQSNNIIKINNINKIFEYTNNEDLLFNKVELVRNMGEYLRYGKFDQLFNLVSLVNQSDPEQEYLKDAEIIYSKRILLGSNKISNLYALALSQILQKKPISAISTIDKILLSEPKNTNAYIAKAICEIYIFNINSAKNSIKKSLTYNKDIKKEEILRKSYSISKLFSFEIFEGLKELTR